MTVDLIELIDQLRDPRRTYPIPGDGPAAVKVATLLENAIASKAPLSTIDTLKGMAEKLLSRSQLLN